MEDYIYLKFDLIWVIFGRDRAPNNAPKRRHFMDPASVQKHLKKNIFRQPQMP